MTKNIIITGGTRGLGLEITNYFLKTDEYNVIVIGRHKNNFNYHLKKTNFYFFKTDLSKLDQIEKSFKMIHDKFTSIDILINNAGSFINKEFSNMSISDINNIIDINLKGYIFCTYFFLKFYNKKFARIINIGSVAGEYGIKNQSVYSASKHGVNGFFESIAQELMKKNIQITTISPGGISTSLWNEKNPYPGNNIENLIVPEDIINQIIYLINQNKNVVVKKIICFPSNEWH